MKSLENVSNNHRKEDLKLLFYGILVGIAAGGLSSFYRYIIHGIEGIIGGIVNISRSHFYIYPIIFIALVSHTVFYMFHWISLILHENHFL